MSDALWSQIDEHFIDLFAPEVTGIGAALGANRDAGLPAIDVSPLQGKFLQTLVAAIGAKRVLEIGTLGGYSTIWMAQGLPPDGVLITLEIDPHHADVAQQNFKAQKLPIMPELRVGPAAESLDAMQQAGEEPFDLIFIDADKASLPVYFEKSLPLANPGSLLIFDNVVRGGAILDSASQDESVRGVQQLCESIHSDPRVSATVLQTVGSKGHDGLALVRVLTQSDS